MFFSNVSHEFRTPLTLMLGPLEDALARNELRAMDRDRLALALRNSHRLLKLVNSLLDFSRIEADRMQAVYEPTDISSVTSELASVLRIPARVFQRSNCRDCSSEQVGPDAGDVFDALQDTSLSYRP
jgi:signal transduction histidine kinase